MRFLTSALTGLTTFLVSAVSSAQPTVGETTVLGPFAGHYAKLHPDNIAPYRIAFYGTDLGWTYEHKGQLQFLFGDSWADEKTGAPIEAYSGKIRDDGFGAVDLSAWRDSGRINSGNIPLIKLGQNPGTTEMSAINPEHAMEYGKVPVAGFSNGNREFAIFYVAKPKGCRLDTDCDNGLTCDAGLGYSGEKFTESEGDTVACMDGSGADCIDDTMTAPDGSSIKGSGFCTDKSSSIWANTPSGRIAAVGLMHRIGIRSTSDPRRYSNNRVWLTNKFLNVTARTVEEFVPSNGPGNANQNYLPAQRTGKNQRVFLWGRPAFMGIAATGRTAKLYFAYADMPTDPLFGWKNSYYSGGDAEGRPHFSANERDAVPVDLDSTVDGVQADERNDIVNQMSVVWIEHLQKWAMFYSGGVITLPRPPFLKCGTLEGFVGPECTKVIVGDGEIRMRTADHPWGPWTPAQEVIASGDPSVPGSGQYGPGGVLHQPGCKAPTCGPHTTAPGVIPDDEYGYFYGANIIAEWIKPVGKSVDVIWNASTWDPYRVVLLRTRINP